MIGARARRWTWLALVTAYAVPCGTLLPAVARATPAAEKGDADDNRAAAQVLFERGRELVERNRFAEACPQFAESQRLDPGIGTLLWLADCYENAGQMANAWTAFSQAADSAAQRRDPREAVARERAAKLEPSLSRLTIIVSPEAAAVADLQIHCDGILLSTASWGETIPLDPGSHTITANAPNHRLWWTVMQLALGATGASVTIPGLTADAPVAAARAPTPGPVESPPASPAIAHRSGHAQRVVAVAIAAGGATAILVGAFFSLKAKATYDDSNAGPLSPCLPDNECTDAGFRERRSASSMATVATFAMASGAGIGAIAAALYLTAPKDARAPINVAFRPGGNGASVDLNWGW